MIAFRWFLFVSFMRKVCAVGGLARHLENWQGIAKSFPCLGMTSLQPKSVIFRAYIKGSRPLGFVDFTAGLGRRLLGWKEPFRSQREILSRESHSNIHLKSHWVICNALVLTSDYNLNNDTRIKLHFKHIVHAAKWSLY